MGDRGNRNWGKREWRGEKAEQERWGKNQREERMRETEWERPFREPPGRGKGSAGTARELLLVSCYCLNCNSLTSTLLFNCHKKSPLAFSKIIFIIQVGSAFYPISMPIFCASVCAFLKCCWKQGYRCKNLPIEIIQFAGDGYEK